MRRLLFDKTFGSNRNDHEPILNPDELQVALFAYDVACDEIYSGQGEPDGDPDDEPAVDECEDDSDSVIFDEKIEAAMKNFEHVIELFKVSHAAKNAFLENFGDWSSFRKSNIKRLEEIAQEIQTDKFNSDIAKVVGGVVGAVGGVVVGLSFLTPLAAVTLPLAISGGVASAVGGGVVVGTTGTEMVLLKNKLEETKFLLKQDEERFSVMNQWFTHTKELKEALESLVSCDLLKDISDDLQQFQEEVKDLANLKVGDFKIEFKKVLTLCIEKMCKFSKIKDLFGILAPVVMTFIIVVCLMRSPNRIVLDCIMQTERLVVGFMSLLDIGVESGQLLVGLAMRGTTAVAEAAPAAVARVAIMGAFVAVAAVIDVINVVLASMDIHNRPDTKSTKKIKEAAEKLEKEFQFIDKVYDELKKWKPAPRTDMIQWKTFIIHRVPADAKPVDIKMAVKIHLLEEAWGCIKVQRSSTDDNNWFVKVPASYSQQLLRQSYIIINKKDSCLVTQWTQWKTVILLHVPDDAVETDIKMGIGPYIPRADLDRIKFQRLSTKGNNWLVKVLDNHGQSHDLLQQSHIIIKGERCLVTQ